MAFKVKIETRRAAFAVQQKELAKRIGETQCRLADKAATDPEGSSGMWAEMLAESIARSGDLRE